MSDAAKTFTSDLATRQNEAAKLYDQMRQGKHDTHISETGIDDLISRMQTVPPESIGIRQN